MNSFQQVKCQPPIYIFIMLSYAHIYVILLVLCLPLQDSASGQSYRNKQASERSSYGTRNRYLYHNRRYPTSAAQKRKTKGKKPDPFKTNILLRIFFPSHNWHTLHSLLNAVYFFKKSKLRKQIFFGDIPTNWPYWNRIIAAFCSLAAESNHLKTSLS